MPKGIKMAEVSWPEIEKAFQAGLPIIIPLGAGCKEHGFHLPMNTDFILAEYLANWTMDNYNVLIAPTIAYNYFPAFEEYPGSSTLSLETSRNYIIELCETWYKQGAKQFYVLNTGISTNKPLAAAQTMLNGKGISFKYFNLSGFYDLPEIKKITEQKVGTHADEIETSIMLLIKPEAVDLDKAKIEESPDKPGSLTRDVSATGKTISVTGAWGNPTLATIEKGKIAVSVLKHMLEEDLEKLFLPKEKLDNDQSPSNIQQAAEIMAKDNKYTLDKVFSTPDLNQTTNKTSPINSQSKEESESIREYKKNQ